MFLYIFKNSIFPRVRKYNKDFLIQNSFLINMLFSKAFVAREREIERERVLKFYQKS